MKKQFDVEELVGNLKQFTGTSQYARLNNKVVLTDGAVFLAEKAQCFWLFDVFASHLFSINSDEEEFACLKLTKDDNTATVEIDDGNGHVLARQDIEYTDFPLFSMTLYGCWSGEYWVLMLPSEY